MMAYTHYEMDNRVSRYAEALAARGDEVDVIALRRAGQKRSQRLNQVNLFRVQRRTVNETSPLTYLVKILGFVFTSGVRVTWRHLKRPYDVIHIHSVPDFEVFAAAVPRLMGAKCILDIHDIVPELYASKFGVGKDSMIFKALVLVEKASIAFAHHVIVANHLWRDRLVARSVRESKCSVFMNYPDPDLFAARQAKPDGEKFVMLYPGTLSRHQGLDIAIRAMALVKQEAPHAELHIYGDGTEKHRLISLCHELDVASNVAIRQPLALPEIAKVIARCDLGIVPKRSDSFGDEAFSTKILEFMASGVPVVAADTTIDRHYFNDSVVRFFESGNAESLAAAVAALIRDSGERNRLAERATEFVRDWTWDQHRQRYFDIADSLVAPRERGVSLAGGSPPARFDKEGSR